MSFALNKMASLLATLLVVGIALFCSSAAQAHVNHGVEAAEVSVEQAAVCGFRAAPASDAADELASADSRDGEDGGDRAAGTSCCGTGMSNCMTATIDASAGSLPAPPSGIHNAVREPDTLDGVVLDGMIRPPRTLV